MDPLSQSVNWQLYLSLLGHTQWDNNQEKEQGRIMGEMLKPSVQSWVFHAAGTTAFLLSSRESSLPPVTTLKGRSSISISLTILISESEVQLRKISERQSGDRVLV